ncbi:Thiamine-phosphate pyrophosphorylase (EC 2.5.1. 3) (TMP pyrophosphorylase) (TMP-PPase) (Thiamine-phosphate synthase) (fragment) [Bradyrhizobium sp. ORS 278]|uniref:thiamine phosphate synthase n=1 Tax=Bradyrhizobium sp. (strain ORS 278) TaxID=114615 RepID=UPI00015077D4
MRRCLASSSKEQQQAPIGLDGLARILAVLRRRAPKLPVCANAGIHAANAASVIAAGADGVAVISALSRSPDPRAAAQLRHVVDHELAARR